MSAWKNAATLDGSDIWSFTALWSKPNGRVVRGRVTSIQHDAAVDDDGVVTYVTVQTASSEVIVVQLFGTPVPLSLSIDDLPDEPSPTHRPT